MFAEKLLLVLNKSHLLSDELLYKRHDIYARYLREKEIIFIWIFWLSFLLSFSLETSSVTFFPSKFAIILLWAYMVQKIVLRCRRDKRHIAGNVQQYVPIIAFVRVHVFKLIFLPIFPFSPVPLPQVQAIYFLPWRIQHGAIWQNVHSYILV